VRAGLTIEVRNDPLERVHADLAIVGWAPEDRPLRREAGRADWRLCGELWALCSSELLRGAVGEAVLIPTAGALRAPLLLALGLGPRSELGAQTWRALGRDALSRALDLRIERLVLGLASDAADSGSAGLEALLCGAALAAGDRGVEHQTVLLPGEGTAMLSRLGSQGLDGWPDGVELRIAGSVGCSTIVST
jgi:hypothetical protein